MRIRLDSHLYYLFIIIYLSVLYTNTDKPKMCPIILTLCCQNPRRIIQGWEISNEEKSYQNPFTPAYLIF